MSLIPVRIMKPISSFQTDLQRTLPLKVQTLAFSLLPPNGSKKLPSNLPEFNFPKSCLPTPLKSGSSNSVLLGTVLYQLKSPLHHSRYSEIKRTFCNNIFHTPNHVHGRGVKVHLLSSQTIYHEWVQASFFGLISSIDGVEQMFQLGEWNIIKSLTPFLCRFFLGFIAVGLQSAEMYLGLRL